MCISSSWCSVPWQRQANHTAGAPVEIQPQSPPTAGPQRAQIFHERQCCSCDHPCLVHALNNLYQSKTFTCCELNNIACSLPAHIKWRACFRAFCNYILKGNNDINVLQRALQFIRGAAMLVCEYPHWTTLKKVDGAWLDLDSHLATPVIIGNDDNVRTFILREFESGSRVIRVWEDMQQ
ncbi:hypothetical protein GOP47_0027292 [Adiantum capillus-veneris]|nr:hypothetical protein GOP47_0027292 [Adiantum capillus-veneris]